VDVPARLQMGLLDLRGDLGRIFGGLGAALLEPRVEVEVAHAAALSAAGPDAERAAGFALRFLRHHGLPPRGVVRVLRAIPPHAGLGSGTRLALAVARGLAELHGLPTDVGSLVSAVARAARSGVGAWTFQAGGLVLDGGHPIGDACRAGAVPPLLFQRALPASWRCVVLLPHARPGLSGDEERRAFERLPRPTEEVSGRIARLVLVGILPAAAEGDLAAFGRALTELQRRVGEVFAPVQGSPFASVDAAALIARLLDAGAAGAGQSSWGPTVYGIVDGDDAARRLEARAREWLGGRGRTFATAFDAAGARVHVA
jgi:beta-RFAP synthase